MKPGAGDQDPNASYKEGDEVFYQAENGQSLFGTIGQVKNQSCQVVFGDGTDKWSPYNLLRKLSFTINEDEKKETPEKKKRRPIPNAEIKCIICGCVVSGIRAPVKTTRHSDSNGKSGSASVASTIFKCSGCISIKPNLSTLIANKLSPTKPGMKLEPVHVNTTHHNSISLNPNNQLRVSSSTSSLKITLSKKRIRESEDLAEKSRRSSEKKLALLPSSSSESSLGNSVIGKNQQPNSLRNSIPIKNEEFNHPKKYLRLSINESKCFHCAENTTSHDRVTCNLCQRPCHHLCLNVKPIPVLGDRHWDVMCDACGTQKARSEKDRVFSVRRNLTSWSDLAYIIVNCLSIKTSQRFFDLESSIVPFLEENNQNLHLPRMFKIVSKDKWKDNIEKALNNNGKLFMNGREVKKKVSYWGIRANEVRISSGPSSSQEITTNSNHISHNLLKMPPTKPIKPQLVVEKKQKVEPESKPIVIHSSAKEIIEKETSLKDFIRLAPSPNKDSGSHRSSSGAPKPSESTPKKRKRESCDSSSSEEEKTNDLVHAVPSTSRVLRPPQPKPDKTETKPTPQKDTSKLGKDGKEMGRAIKSATIAPPPPQAKGIKVGRPKKDEKAKGPSLNDTLVGIPGPGVPRGRGRPKLNTLPDGGKKSGTSIKKETLSTAPVPGKRISSNGHKNGFIYPSNPVQNLTHVFNGSVLKETNFNPLEESLQINAFYGFNRIECLPEDPKTLEKYLMDKKKLADMFNSEIREEKEKKMMEEEYLKRAKGAIGFGSEKKKRDEDNYEVIGRRVDEDGLVRVLVRYKNDEEEEEQPHEEEKEDA